MIKGMLEKKPLERIILTNSSPSIFGIVKSQMIISGRYPVCISLMPSSALSLTTTSNFSLKKCWIIIKTDGSSSIAKILFFVVLLIADRQEDQSVPVIVMFF